MNKFSAHILAAAILAACPSWALAQATQVASTTASAVPEGSMTAVIESVAGLVQVRENKTAPWVKAEVGMKLGEGAYIRTGPRSAIRCHIDPDQTFTLDRLGTVELLQAVKEGGKIKTDLSMPYGRTQYEIQDLGLQHESSIVSPGSTLAVRGTTVEVENTPPFLPRAVSYTGRARFTAGSRSTDVGSKGGREASMNTAAFSSADAALLASVLDPQSSGSRTPSDTRVISREVSRGATLAYDPLAGITTITGGAGPIKKEADLIPALPGTLDFVARWTGNADINLLVYVSKGNANTNGFFGSDPAKAGRFVADEFVYPGFGLNQTASGGRTDFDHKGGPNGGTEVVYWKGSYPEAIYGVNLIHVSGASTPVTLNVFLNGKKQAIFDFAPLPGVTLTPNGPKSTTYTYQLSKGQFGSPLVFIPPATALASLPDANNGASADLVGPVAPKTASAKIKARQATAKVTPTAKTVRKAK